MNEYEWMRARPVNAIAKFLVLHKQAETHANACKFLYYIQFSPVCHQWQVRPGTACTPACQAMQACSMAYRCLGLFRFFFTVCNFSNFGIVDNRHFGFRIVTSVSISVFQTIGYRLSVRFFGIEYRLLLLLLSPRPLLLLQRQQWAQGSACIMSIDWRWCSSLLHRHRTMHRSELGTGYNHLSDRFNVVARVMFLICMSFDAHSSWHSIGARVQVFVNKHCGMDDLQKVKKFLRQWESEFFQQHKRKPSKVGSVVHTDWYDNDADVLGTGNTGFCFCFCISLHAVM